MENRDRIPQSQNVEPEGQATGDQAPEAPPSQPPVSQHKEVGGRDGLDPTRYGDWEKNGRCIDF